MNALVIAAREIRERRLYLLGALLVGVMSVIVPRFNTRPSDLADVAHLALLSAVIPLAVVLTLSLGFSLFARPLSEGRLSFYFTKPVGAWSIWSGKALGGTALVALSLLIAIVPLLVQPKVAGLLRSDLADAGIAFAIALVGLMVVSHFVAVGLLAHSRWLAVDYLVTPVLIALGVVAAGRLESADAFVLTLYVLVFYALLVLASLIAASAIGIVRGRSGIRQVHRATSLTAVSGIAIATVAVIAFSWWSTSGTVDLKQPFQVENASAQGNSIAIASPVHHLETGHVALFDVASKKLTPIGATPYSSLAISDDGLFAAWTERETNALPAIKRFRTQLMLRTADARTRQTGLGFDQEQPFDSPLLSISPDNRIVASLWHGEVAMIDTSTLRSLASFRLPARTFARMAFVSPTTLRLYTSDRGSLVHIVELDPATRRMTARGTFSSSPALRWNRRSDTIVVSTPGNPTTVRTMDLLSASDGHLIRHVEPHGTLLSAWPGETALFVVSQANGHIHLDAIPLDGSPARTIDVGAGERAMIGGEPAAGLLTVSIATGAAPAFQPRDFKPAIVDWMNGSVHPLAISGYPVARHSWVRSDVPAAGSIATRLFVSNGTRVLLDPKTLQTRDLF